MLDPTWKNQPEDESNIRIQMRGGRRWNHKTSLVMRKPDFESLGYMQPWNKSTGGQ